MILNSKYSNFLVRLPVDFIPVELTKKYSQFLKKLPYPFKDLNEYLNWTIQSISWPEIATQTVEQGTRDDTRSFAGGLEPFHYATRQFDITFKTTESFINYYLMQEILIDYFAIDNPNHRTFLPDIQLHLLDNSGTIIVSYIFRHCVFEALSGLELSYSANVPEWKTFTAQFKYRTFEILYNYD